MPKVRGRVLNKLTGEDLYQDCKRKHEGEYMGLDEVDGLKEAEAEVRAYFEMVNKELSEGLQ